MDVAAKPGTNINLSAKGSYDPDGNKLTYTWWQYEEAGTYKGTIEIKNAKDEVSSFTVPLDAVKGQKIHIICEVTDNGAPPLTRYQRVVVTVK